MKKNKKVKFYLYIEGNTTACIIEFNIIATSMMLFQNKCTHGHIIIYLIYDWHDISKVF